MTDFTVSLTDSQNQVIGAYATIKATTVSALVAQYGVIGAYTTAINDQITTVVASGTFPADVVALLTSDTRIVERKLRESNSQGKLPASIIAGLISRASTPSA